ncbi:coiled-coil domain-containing protein 68 isoform X1 [Chelonia mydas]|uniref:coiled-coil domain-containing protein 68 isoform X1 n=1 Tax=Chelonia mydas TaxID=8469 RepID=UPI0018A20225|nr:coiled-coil domain-containing protein 68 isoform X1 [Chelonia mydas]XP_043403438.1 coiled-coil domain-containing protein 68 isoform X1 [Chelonia mydas]
MNTTVRLTEHVTRDDQGMEGNYVLYGSSSAQITEETEYIKKIRSTLAKIQNQQPFRVSRNELEAEKDTLNSSYNLTMEKLKETDQQLLLVNRENEILKIKLDATREAGAQSLRRASKSLYENYYSRSEELKKKHEDDKLLMQASKLEQEQKLKQNLENVNCVTERLEEKYSQITDMEKLVQRMEEEKKTLIAKKQSFEEKLLSNSEDSKSCRDLQVEIFTLQEQISHLQHVIQTQHQSLRSVIEEIEELNIGLQNQDKEIKTMKEKINMLETQNKELKYKVEFWSGQPKIKVSKGVSTTSSRIDGVSPYSLLTRLRKQNG